MGKIYLFVGILILLIGSVFALTEFFSKTKDKTELDKNLICEKESKLKFISSSDCILSKDENIDLKKSQTSLKFEILSDGKQEIVKVYNGK